MAAGAEARLSSRAPAFPVSSGPVLTRRLLLREVIIALVPVVALLVEMAWSNLLFLDYVHVITGGTWTGIDLFMGLVVSRVLRALPVTQRAAVAQRLTPREMFLLPALASVAITSGIYLAQSIGMFNLSDPRILAAGIVVIILAVQGFGLLLPNSVRILLETTKPNPNVEKIARINQRNLLVAGSQAAFQIIIIFIMATLAI